VLSLAKAWDLISAAPARASGLTDRGVLASGRRADIILIDDTTPLRPRLAAVIAGGRLVHVADMGLLRQRTSPSRKAVVMA
jgi:alpha-D-ribose 1-methylphosphonate 5-triphosphate diphosphatase